MCEGDMWPAHASPAGKLRPAATGLQLQHSRCCHLGTFRHLLAGLQQAVSSAPQSQKLPHRRLHEHARTVLCCAVLWCSRLLAPRSPLL